MMMVLCTMMSQYQGLVTVTQIGPSQSRCGGRRRRRRVTGTAKFPSFKSSPAVLGECMGVL
jgi:hypothetical protein